MVDCVASPLLVPIHFGSTANLKSHLGTPPQSPLCQNGRPERVASVPVAPVAPVDLQAPNPRRPVPHTRQAGQNKCRSGASMRKLIALALFVCAAVLAAPQPTKAIICQLGLCPTTPPALPTSSVGPGPWIVGRVMVSAPRSPMGRAVQLGLDKSAVVRLLRVTIEGLDRAEH